MPNIGDMKHYLTLQQYGTAAQNAFGEETQGWADRTSCWAQIMPLSGDELMTARQLNPEVTHRIDMWYTAAMYTQQRLKYGTRYFYILSVVNVNEESQFMQLMCVEKVK